MGACICPVDCRHRTVAHARARSLLFMNDKAPSAGTQSGAGFLGGGGEASQ